MDNAIYDALRHFADSWGLLYMMAIFLIVIVRLVLPGARGRASAAAQIPLADDYPRNNETDR
jgi:cytochrome c oxidase cbb3-type subunit IV